MRSETMEEKNNNEQDFYRVNIGKVLETSRRREDEWTSMVVRVYLIGWANFKVMRCIGLSYFVYKPCKMLFCFLIK